MRHLLLVLCWLAARQGVRGFKNLFACPPWRENRGRAYRIPVGQNKYYIPVIASIRPNSKHLEVVVIPVHGARIETDTYFGDMLKTVGMRKTKNNQGKIGVVAPAFPYDSCSAKKWGKNGNSVQTSLSFKEYSLGTLAKEGVMTSFEALDRVVAWSQTSYRTPKMIVITGFSAGGQMVQKWSIMSPVGVNGVRGRTRIRMIVGGPGSMLYMNSQRPMKSCAQLKVPGRCHTCTAFPVAGSGGNEAASACKYPNPTLQYPTDTSGLGDTRLSKEFTGVRSYLISHIKGGNFPDTYEKTLRDRYRTKDVRFLFGKDDTKNCVIGACKGTCQMMTQGTSRLQRGLNYMAYLSVLFPGYTPKWGIYEAGHRHYEAWWGAHFEYWVFKELWGRSRSPALKNYRHQEKRMCGVHGAKGGEAMFREPEYCYNANTCMKKCSDEPACKGFTMEERGHKCWLMKQVDPNKCKKTNGWQVRYMVSKGADKSLGQDAHVDPPEGGLDMPLERSAIEDMSYYFKEGEEEAAEMFGLGGESDDDGDDEPGGMPVGIPLLAAVAVLAGLGFCITRLPRRPAREPNLVETGATTAPRTSAATASQEESEPMLPK